MKNGRYIIIAVVFVALVAAAGIDGGTQAVEVGAGITIEASGGPNSQYVAVDDAGKISIDLSEANQDVAGAGVNDNAVVRFDNVVLINNTNDRRAFVYLSDETDAIEFVESGQGVGGTGSSIEGQDNEVVLDGGEQLTVGFAVDTTNQIDDIETTFTLVARITEAAEALLEVGREPANAGEPVVFDASSSLGENLKYEYAFSDGVVREDAGSQIERTITEPGTYDVTLTVTETGDVEEETTDSVVVEFVVLGEGSTKELDNETETTIEHPEENTTGVIRTTEIEFDVEVDGNVSSETVANESVADITGEHPENETVGATNITVPAEQEDVDATMRLTVTRSAIPQDVSPSELAIEHYDEDAAGWETLPTSVASTTTDTVVLEARTPGFSVFAVTIQGGEEADDGDDGGGGGGGGSRETPNPTSTKSQTPNPTSTKSQTPTHDETPTESTTDTPVVTSPAQTPTETDAPATTHTSTSTETDAPTTTHTSTPTETDGLDPVSGLVIAVIVVVAVAALLYRRYVSESE
jgi:PGF-pre-PGF domain-containing protein